MGGFALGCTTRMDSYAQLLNPGPPTKELLQTISALPSRSHTLPPKTASVTDKGLPSTTPMPPTQRSSSDLDGDFRRPFQYRNRTISMSSEEDDDDRRPAFSVSRLLSFESDEEERAGGDPLPVPVLEPPRGPPRRRTASPSGGGGGGRALLLSVLGRVAGMDHSALLRNAAHQPHKRPIRSGGGDALRKAVKRLRADEEARAEETRRMVTIAMSRTDETGTAASAAAAPPAAARGAPSAVQQKQQLRVVMAGKVGRNDARDDGRFVAAAEGGRVVAVTGGSVVLAPGTPTKVPAKRVVARARCA